MNKVLRARILHHDHGLTVSEISRHLNESPFLVAQWVKVKK